jgi:hypothetical protein
MKLIKLVYTPADVLRGASTRYFTFARTSADVADERVDHLAGDNALLTAETGTQLLPFARFGELGLQDTDVEEFRQAMPRPLAVPTLNAPEVVGVHAPVLQPVSLIENPPAV